MARWIEKGDPRSPYWVIGEAPGADEVAQGVPFVGASGQELDRMLAESGWNPSDFFYTNVAHERPPSVNKRGKWIHNDIEQFFPGVTLARKEGIPPFRGRWPRPPIIEGIQHLEHLLATHHPRLILCLGGTPLWALCDKSGITKWRGSELKPSPEGPWIIPTFHPADVLRQWPHRFVVVQDFKRAKRVAGRSPAWRQATWNTLIEPSLKDVREWFHSSLKEPELLVCDTEGWGVVDAIGFASSPKDAICIPFVREEGEGQVQSYWSLDDEVEVFSIIQDVLTKNAIAFHQGNGMWDNQVIGRNWGYMPNVVHDTMVGQHVLFPGLLGGKIDPVTGKVDKKGSSLNLAFVASMYCDQYVYWKDDGRVRDEDYTDRQYWSYNCEDCLRTFEVLEAEQAGLKALKLVPQYELLMRLFPIVTKMMFRGIKIDLAKAREMREYVHRVRATEQAWLDEVLGFPLNVGSWPQMQALFYEDFDVKRVLHRSTKKPTLDDDALEVIARREPLLVPLIRHIQNLRSLGTNEANFIRPALRDRDRYRTTLNPAGAETFRFTSSETAFGEGSNMQNLTRNDE